MTVTKNIEKNANLVLWCVHVLGPDDVMAAPSHNSAAITAHEMNKAFHGRVTTAADVLCFAYAAPWPHTPEDHAQAVKQWLVTT